MCNNSKIYVLFLALKTNKKTKQNKKQTCSATSFEVFHFKKITLLSILGVKLL